MTVRTYDLTGVTDDRIEKGDYAEPGWHHARISDVVEDYDYNSIKLEFTILGGPSEGKKVSDILKDFEDVTISESGRRVRHQMHLVRAKRLGLLPPESDRTGSFSIDWNQALAKECYIKVQQRTYDKADGTKGHVTELTFDGVYPLDDERVPEAAKQHQPCGLDELSEADKKRQAEKEAAKGAKAAEKGAKGANGGGRKRGGAASTATAAAASAPAQTDFGDI